MPPQFLRSDVARLVMSYILDKDLKATAEAFLQESCDLPQDLRDIPRGDWKECCRVNDRNLVEILQEYGAICSEIKLVAMDVDSNMYTSHKYDAPVQVLKLLIQKLNQQASSKQDISSLGQGGVSFHTPPGKNRHSSHATTPTRPRAPSKSAGRLRPILPKPRFDIDRSNAAQPEITSTLPPAKNPVVEPQIIGGTPPSYVQLPQGILTNPMSTNNAATITLPPVQVPQQSLVAPNGGQPNTVRNQGIPTEFQYKPIVLPSSTNNPSFQQQAQSSCADEDSNVPSQGASRSKAYSDDELIMDTCQQLGLSFASLDGANSRIRTPLSQDESSMDVTPSAPVPSTSDTTNTTLQKEPSVPDQPSKTVSANDSRNEKGERSKSQEEKSLEQPTDNVKQSDPKYEKGKPKPLKEICLVEYSNAAKSHQKDDKYDDHVNEPANHNDKENLPTPLADFQLEGGEITSIPKPVKAIKNSPLTVKSVKLINMTKTVNKSPSTSPADASRSMRRWNVLLQPRVGLQQLGMEASNPAETTTDQYEGSSPSTSTDGLTTTTSTSNVAGDSFTPSQWTHLLTFKQPLSKDQLGLADELVTGANQSSQLAQPAPHTPSLAVAGQPVVGSVENVTSSPSRVRSLVLSPPEQGSTASLKKYSAGSSVSITRTSLGSLSSNITRSSVGSVSITRTSPGSGSSAVSGSSIGSNQSGSVRWALHNTSEGETQKCEGEIEDEVQVIGVCEAAPQAVSLQPDTSNANSGKGNRGRGRRIPDILRRPPQKSSLTKSITSIQQQQKEPQQQPPASQITIEPHFVMNIEGMPLEVSVLKPSTSGYTTVHPTKDAVTTTSSTGLLQASKPSDTKAAMGSNSNTCSLTTNVGSFTLAAKSASGDKKKAIPWDEEMRACLTEKEKDNTHITNRKQVKRRKTAYKRKLFKNQGQEQAKKARRENEASNSTADSLPATAPVDTENTGINATVSGEAQPLNSAAAEEAPTAQGTSASSSKSTPGKNTKETDSNKPRSKGGVP